MKRLACALLLAGCTLALSGIPNTAEAARARAQGGPRLTLITPDPATVVDRLTIDASYRGSAVQAVELYLDGALVAKRQIGTARSVGIVSFVLDTVLLTEGAHDVQVKAYSADGGTLTASTKIRLPGADLSAPVRIAYPQNGLLVSGIVPVRVAVDSDLQRQKPYVTFFVDKELKLLRNYPPYEYAWDTTRVSNGWHMLEAWTQTSQAMAPTKARPVHVNVNNGGGETRKQNGVDDLRTKQPITLSPAAVGAGQTRPEMTVGVPASPGASARPQARGAVRASEPSVHGYASATPGPVSRPAVEGSPAQIQGPAPQMMGGAVTEPVKRMVVASAPKALLPTLTPAGGLVPVVAPSSSGTGTVKVQPGETLGSVSRRTGVEARQIARLNNLDARQDLKSGQSLIVPKAGSFDVAFDGTRIVFDVAPRVENGMGLTPFRQIFEHTGGRLYWFGGVQVVRAVNERREIELKIGRPTATVNNQTLKMQRAPYIDTGRTIVPLTFIRDAMDVKVHFDARSGRLLIQSR